MILILEFLFHNFGLNAKILNFFLVKPFRWNDFLLDGLVAIEDSGGLTDSFEWVLTFILWLWKSGNSQPVKIRNASRTSETPLSSQQAIVRFQIRTKSARYLQRGVAEVTYRARIPIFIILPGALILTCGDNSHNFLASIQVFPGHLDIRCEA